VSPTDYDRDPQFDNDRMDRAMALVGGTLMFVILLAVLTVTVFLPAAREWIQGAGPRPCG